MSVMGTGVAAGVAQAASNAEGVARRRDKRANRQSEETRRVREIFEANLKALEEHDEGENTARIYTDSQVPQHESHQDPVPEKHRHEAGQEAAAMPDPSAAPPRPRPKRAQAANAYANAFDLTVDPDTGHASATLHSHVDVTA